MKNRKLFYCISFILLFSQTGCVSGILAYNARQRVARERIRLSGSKEGQTLLDANVKPTRALRMIVEDDGEDGRPMVKIGIDITALDTLKEMGFWPTVGGVVADGAIGYLIYKELDGGSDGGGGGGGSDPGGVDLRNVTVGRDLNIVSQSGTGNRGTTGSDATLPPASP